VSVLDRHKTVQRLPFRRETLAYGLVTAGLALSPSQVGGVAGRVLWGWVSDRWLGASRMLALLAALMAASALATALLQSALPLVLVLGTLIVFGASATGWNGVFLAEVARQAPAGQASIATGGPWPSLSSAWFSDRLCSAQSQACSTVIEPATLPSRCPSLYPVSHCSAGGVKRRPGRRPDVSTLHRVPRP
jgi:MFS family permease